MGKITWSGVWRWTKLHKYTISLITIGVFLLVSGLVLLTRTGQRPFLVDAAESVAIQNNGVNAGGFFIPDSIFVDSATSGQPWAPIEGLSVSGVFTFRGNPTRSYYGEGPLPSNPEVLWRYPGPSLNSGPSFNSDPLCSLSSFQGQEVVWCGTGWTGQPVLVERPHPSDPEGELHRWLIFGAYDGKVHFLDADTGEQIFPPFQTGDIIKGTITIDPEGYPLIYVGSRDNYIRVIAIDGDVPEELWKLSAKDPAIAQTLWNDDWDSSPLVISDYLLAGGENSNFHIIRLNRSYDGAGLVLVNPELLHVLPGWSQELLENLGDTNVSIENSPVIVGSVLYFANSGGLVQGWDLSTIKTGSANQFPERVFSYWVGDDVDASLVADKEGMLYVSVERDRLASSNPDYVAANARSDMVGQLLKLDPTVRSVAENPAEESSAEESPFSDTESALVWSVFDVGGANTAPSEAGIWATPALHEGILYVGTQTGRLLAVDTDTGDILWEENFRNRIWSSPVVVEDVLLAVVPNASNYELRAYDLAGPTTPQLLWTVGLEGVVESTPLVWEGMIFVGNREGYMLAIGDPA